MRTTLPRTTGILPTILLALLMTTDLPAQTALTEHTLRRDPAAPPSTTTLADLAFLVGHWQGEAFGGIAEESWLPALGGSMSGTFKLVVDGAVEMQELMNLAPDSAAGLVLRVKHFDGAMSAWEEKEEMLRFAFHRAERATAWFSGLTFERIGDDRLNIYLAMRQKDGSTSESAMHFYRVGSAAHVAWSAERGGEGH